MTQAEGWDGKSLRSHIESAAVEATGARELGETNCDEVAALRAEIEELAGRVGKLEEPAPAKEPNGDDTSASELKRAVFFSKVQQVNAEIAKWNHFLIEARGVRAALAQFAALPGTVKDRRHD